MVSIASIPRQRHSRRNSVMNRRNILAFAASYPLLACGASAQAAARLWRRERIITAGLSSPVGMGLDSEGRLVVANWSAGTVIRVTQDGKTTALATGLSGPSGLAIAANGDIFVASYNEDLVWRIPAAGGKPEVFVRGLSTPAGISFDNRGKLLIANRRTNQILAVDPAGKHSVAVEGELQTPVGAVQMPDGGYFVSNIDGGVSCAGPDGRARTVSRDFVAPGPGIAVADAGSVYVVDYGGTEVKQVHKDGTTHVVAAGFRSPAGIALSADRRRAVVTDWGSNAAYEMSIGAG
ncbi:NHL repeat-containing protein [Verminephrobacter eiseniae]|nr:hypothetical protein [Verminephrobacter eiseniae]